MNKSGIFRLKNSVYKVLRVQLIFLALLLFTYLLLKPSSIQSVLYGGFTAILLTAYLGYSLHRKKNKALMKEDESLFIKGVGVLQVSRYAIVAVIVYLSVKMGFDMISVLLSFSLMQVAFWVALFIKD